MTRKWRRPQRPGPWRRPTAATIAALMVVMLALAGCSGNKRRVSVGGSVHMGSGGSWGHSLSVGIHSHRVRR